MLLLRSAAWREEGERGEREEREGERRREEEIGGGNRKKHSYVVCVCEFHKIKNVQ